MSTSFTAASIEGSAATSKQVQESTSFNETAKNCIQILHRNYASKYASVTIEIRIPHESFGPVRTVNRIAIATRNNPQTRVYEGCNLFVFETPPQAQAWAKKLRRGYDQTLVIGDECKSLVFVTPLKPGNGLVVFGEKLRWDDMILRVIPAQNMAGMYKH